MQGIFTAGGRKAFLAGRRDAEVLLDQVFLAKLVYVALVNTHTSTTQNWAHDSDNEPASLTNQIQVYHVARATNTQSQNQNDHSGEKHTKCSISVLWDRKRGKKKIAKPRLTVGSRNWYLLLKCASLFQGHLQNTYVYMYVCIQIHKKIHTSCPEQCSEFRVGEQLANGGLRWKDAKHRDTFSFLSISWFRRVILGSLQRMVPFFSI